MASLALVAPATPAVADPALTVNVDPPNVDGAAVTVSGSAHMSNPLGLDQVTGLAVTVTARAAGGPTKHCDGCGASFGASDTSFSFTTAELAYNGPYDVTVDASGKLVLNALLNGAAVSTRATTSFNVEVAPAAPSGVTAAVNPDRSVTVSWLRNTEPDLIGYKVARRSGSGPLVQGPMIPQPGDGSRVQFTDPSTANPGGDFGYVVVAVRPDGDGQESDRAVTASAEATVTVPVLGGGPGTTGAPGTPGTGGNAGASGRIVTPGGADPFSPAASSSLDLGSFLTAGGAPPKISLPAGVKLPDGTYSPTLPFGSKNAGAQGGDEVEILGHSASRRTLFLPVAAGLLMCMIGLHLRRFNHHVLHAPVEH